MCTMLIFAGPPEPDLHPDVFVCEILGNTFFMCFGCLGMYARPDDFGPMPPLRIALIFSFLIFAISIAIGYVSGCQLSPCVTLCSIILGRISPVNALLCTVAELLGSFLGMAMAVLLVPSKLHRDYATHVYCGFCTTCLHPNLNVVQGLIIQFLTLFVFILCVCSVSDPRNQAANSSNPINFVGVVGVLVIATGPLTGCSLNPFRSLAPAVFSNCWKHHWIYWVGPFAGSAAATFLYKYVLQEKEPAITTSTSSSYSGNEHLNLECVEYQMNNLRINRNELVETRTRTRTRRTDQIQSARSSSS